MDHHGCIKVWKIRCLLLFICSSLVSCAESIPGRLTGELRFSNGDAAPVQGRLAAVPTQPDVGTSIRLATPTSTAIIESSSYSVDVPPVAATYDLNPSADPPGPTYLIEGIVNFTGSTYRFGSRHLNSPWA